MAESDLLNMKLMELDHKEKKFIIELSIIAFVLLALTDIAMAAF